MTTPEDELGVWTVYDHPTDYPDRYVARQWFSSAEGVRPTATMITSEDLRIIRFFLDSFGLVQMDRRPGDDPVIMETWI